MNQELSTTQAEAEVRTETQLATAGEVTVEVVSDELLPEAAETETVAIESATDLLASQPQTVDIIAFTEGLPAIPDLPDQKLALVLVSSQSAITPSVKPSLPSVVDHANRIERRAGKNV
jgi:hypothetical protein